MKHSADYKTQEIPGFARPRGRPPSGQALSSADRQRARRERLRAAGSDVLTVQVDSDVLEALRGFAQAEEITQGDAVSSILRDRLLRKR